jgi:pimeloyl-ACP methyl ester carboxylesterase
MSSPFEHGHTGMSVVEGQATEGYAAVNGVGMYWRSTGTGGVPLVLVHGGFGLADMFGDLLRRPYDWTDDVRGPLRRPSGAGTGRHGRVLPRVTLGSAAPGVRARMRT